MNVTFDTYDKCCWDAPEMTFDLAEKPGLFCRGMRIWDFWGFWFSLKSGAVEELDGGRCQGTVDSREGEETRLIGTKRTGHSSGM